MPFLVLLQGSPWAFAASSVTLAVIGIASSYVLARRVLPSPRAAFAVLVVILFPGFALLATTFMTDVPAYAAEMLCLAVGAVALSRAPANHRRRWLVASLVIGCWAFSIREFALAAPVAVVIAAMASDPSEPRRRYLFALDAVLAVCVAIYLVAHNLPGQPAIHLTPFAPGAVAQVVAGVTTLALLLAPAMVLAAATWIPIWRRPTDAAGRRRRARATIGAGVGWQWGSCSRSCSPTITGCSRRLERGTAPASSWATSSRRRGHSPATSWRVRGRRSTRRSSGRGSRSSRSWPRSRAWPDSEPRSAPEAVISPMTAPSADVTRRSGRPWGCSRSSRWSTPSRR